MGIYAEDFTKIETVVATLIEELAAKTGESRWYIARLIEQETVNFQRKVRLSQEHNGNG